MDFKTFIAKREKQRRPWLFVEKVKGKGPGYHAPHFGRPGQVGGSRPRKGGGTPQFSSGSQREVRRKRGIYDIITETDEETAKILLTQGIEPSFKPRIAGRGPSAPGAPGKGLERDGIYTANEESFGKGSFGQVRLYLTARKEMLAVPEEGTRLGWKREEIDPVLESNIGAVTVGVVPKNAFVVVEVRREGKWVRMSPNEYLKSIGVTPNTPKLPNVPSYRKWVEKNAELLFLSPDKVDWVVHDYNRANLEDKLWMAKEAGLI